MKMAFVTKLNLTAETENANLNMTAIKDDTDDAVLNYTLIILGLLIITLLHVTAFSLFFKK